MGRKAKEPTELEKFILKAKQAGYVRACKGGKKISPTRKGSTDLVFDQGDYHYHDSYVGNTRFAGQETVCYQEKTIWSMIYYGYLVEPNLISQKEYEFFLKEALADLIVCRCNSHPHFRMDQIFKHVDIAQNQR